MTALSKYDRLEAPGLWRASAEAQRLNVIVSVGDATLTISDNGERALSHWSLPAVHRLNPGTRPALYAPSGDPEETETLEIDDDEMISAIEKVRRVVERSQPHAGRLRLILTLATLLAGIILATTWLPGALRRQTVAVLPAVTRQAVGDQLLTRIQRVTGRPCAEPAGRAALARLGSRALGNESARLLVVPDGVATAGHLPGGIILLNRALVEDYEEPDVAAGFIIAEAERARRADPMANLLKHAGTWATARLLTTGEIADSVLDSYAETLLTTPPAPLPDGDLVARFAEAGIRTSPYAFALDQTGETTLGLIEADPVPLAQAQPLLPDADWIRLQGICEE